MEEGLTEDTKARQFYECIGDLQKILRMVAPFMITYSPPQFALISLYHVDNVLDGGYIVAEVLFYGYDIQ
jgi:hypothetical protein